MKPKHFQKTTAFLTLVCFLFEQSLYADLPQTLRDLRQQDEIRLSASLPESLLPAELGSVVEISGTTPSVIVLQDAHGHYEAQKKIEAILNFFEEKDGFRKIFLEGAAGRLEPGLLRFFEEEKFNRDAGETLAREAEIGGGELFLLGQPDFPAYGAEDPKVYVENYLRFQKVIRNKKVSDAYLDSELVGIKTLASKKLSSALLDYFREWLVYEDSSNLVRFSGALQKFAQKTLSLDLNDARHQREWPMLVRFMELKKREPLIDEKKAKEDRLKLLAWMKEKGISGKFRQEIEAEGPKSGGLRTFWETFYEEAHPKGFDFKLYPDLFIWEGARLIEEELQVDSLLQEIGELNNRLLEALAQKDEERKVIHRLRSHLFLKKLFSLELTREEYETFKKTSPAAPASEEVRPVYQDALRFYELAGQRDRIMFEKILSETEQPSSGRSILIAGGFHTEGLAFLLKEKKIPYAVIRPRIEGEAGNEKYLASMMGTRRALDFFGSTTSNPRWLNPDSAWKSWGLPETDLAVRAEIRRSLFDHFSRLGTQKRTEMRENILAEYRKIVSQNSGNDVKAVAAVRSASDDDILKVVGRKIVPETHRGHVYFFSQPIDAAAGIKSQLVVYRAYEGDGKARILKMQSLLPGGGEYPIAALDFFKRVLEENGIRKLFPKSLKPVEPEKPVIAAPAKPDPGKPVILKDDNVEIALVLEDKSEPAGRRVRYAVIKPASPKRLGTLHGILGANLVIDHFVVDGVKKSKLEINTPVDAGKRVDVVYVPKAVRSETRRNETHVINETARALHEAHSLQSELSPSLNKLRHMAHKLGIAERMLEAMLNSKIALSSRRTAEDLLTKVITQLGINFRQQAHHHHANAKELDGMRRSAEAATAFGRAELNFLEAQEKLEKALTRNISDPLTKKQLAVTRHHLAVNAMERGYFLNETGQPEAAADSFRQSLNYFDLALEMAEPGYQRVLLRQRRLVELTLSDPESARALRPETRQELETIGQKYVNLLSPLYELTKEQRAEVRQVSDRAEGRIDKKTGRRRRPTTGSFKDHHDLFVASIPTRNSHVKLHRDNHELLKQYLKKRVPVSLVVSGFVWGMGRLTGIFAGTLQDISKLEEGYTIQFKSLDPSGVGDSAGLRSLIKENRIRVGSRYYPGWVFVHSVNPIEETRAEVRSPVTKEEIEGLISEHDRPDIDVEGNAAVGFFISTDNKYKHGVLKALRDRLSRGHPDHGFEWHQNKKADQNELMLEIQLPAAVADRAEMRESFKFRSLSRNLTVRVAFLTFLVAWFVKALFTFFLQNDPSVSDSVPMMFSMEQMINLPFYYLLFFIGDYGFELNHHQIGTLSKILFALLSLPFLAEFYRIGKNKPLIRKKLGQIGLGLFVGSGAGNTFEAYLTDKVTNYVSIRAQQGGMIANLEDFIITFPVPALISLFLAAKIYERYSRGVDPVSRTEEIPGRAEMHSEVREPIRWVEKDETDFKFHGRVESLLEQLELNWFVEEVAAAGKQFYLFIDQKEKDTSVLLIGDGYLVVLPERLLGEDDASLERYLRREIFRVWLYHKNYLTPEQWAKLKESAALNKPHAEALLLALLMNWFIKLQRGRNIETRILANLQHSLQRRKNFYQNLGKTPEWLVWQYVIDYFLFLKQIKIKPIKAYPNAVGVMEENYRAAGFMDEARTELEKFLEAEFASNSWTDPKIFSLAYERLQNRISSRTEMRSAKETKEAWPEVLEKQDPTFRFFGEERFPRWANRIFIGAALAVLATFMVPFTLFMGTVTILGSLKAQFPPKEVQKWIEFELVVLVAAAAIGLPFYFIAKAFWSKWYSPAAKRETLVDEIARGILSQSDFERLQRLSQGRTVALDLIPQDLLKTLFEGRGFKFELEDPRAGSFWQQVIDRRKGLRSLTTLRLMPYVTELQKKSGREDVAVRPEKGMERVSIFVPAGPGARADLETLREALSNSFLNYQAGSVVKEGRGTFKLTLYRRPGSTDRAETRDPDSEAMLQQIQILMKKNEAVRIYLKKNQNGLANPVEGRIHKVTEGWNGIDLLWLAGHVLPIPAPNIDRIEENKSLELRGEIRKNEKEFWNFIRRHFVLIVDHDDGRAQGLKDKLRASGVPSGHILDVPSTGSALPERPALKEKRIGLIVNNSQTHLPVEKFKIIRRPYQRHLAESFRVYNSLLYGVVNAENFESKVRKFLSEGPKEKGPVRSLPLKQAQLFQRRAAILFFMISQAGNGDWTRADQVPANLQKDIPKVKIGTIYGDLQFLREAGLLEYQQKKVPVGISTNRGTYRTPGTMLKAMSFYRLADTDEARALQGKSREELFQYLTETRTEMRDEYHEMIQQFFVDPSGANGEQVKAMFQNFLELALVHLKAVDFQKPPVNVASYPDLRDLFHTQLPLQGIPFEDVRKRYLDQIEAFSIRQHDPRWAAHLVSQPSIIGIAVELLIGTLNANMISWESSLTASFAEEEVIRWLGQMVGYDPEKFGGSIVTGGTAGNETALMMARDEMIRRRFEKLHRELGITGPIPDVQNDGLPHVVEELKKLDPHFSGRFVVLANRDVHYSVEKIAGLIGIGRKNVNTETIPGKSADEIIREQIERHEKEGDLVIALVATASTTEKGRFDPLEAIAAVAEEKDVWLHVDAAHGGALKLSSKYRHLVNGLELADSVTFDPHKWLYVPYSTGAVLFKDASIFQQGLDRPVPYLNREDERKPWVLDLGRYTLMGSKRFDALKLWFALQMIGADNLGRIIDYTVDQTKEIAKWLETQKDFEVSDPVVNLLTFRFVPQDLERELDGALEVGDQPKIEALNRYLNELNTQLYQRLTDEGLRYVSTTKLKHTVFATDGNQPESNGLVVLRNVIMNPYVTQAILQKIYLDIHQIAKELDQQMRSEMREEILTSKDSPGGPVEGTAVPLVSGQSARGAVTGRIEEVRRFWNASDRGEMRSEKKWLDRLKAIFEPAVILLNQGRWEELRATLGALKDLKIPQEERTAKIQNNLQLLHVLWMISMVRGISFSGELDEPSENRLFEVLELARTLKTAKPPLVPQLQSYVHAEEATAMAILEVDGRVGERFSRPLILDSRVPEGHRWGLLSLLEAAKFQKGPSSGFRNSSYLEQVRNAMAYWLLMLKSPADSFQLDWPRAKWIEAILPSLTHFLKGERPLEPMPFEATLPILETMSQSLATIPGLLVKKAKEKSDRELFNLGSVSSYFMSEVAQAMNLTETARMFFSLSGALQVPIRATDPRYVFWWPLDSMRTEMRSATNVAEPSNHLIPGRAEMRTLDKEEVETKLSEVFREAGVNQAGDLFKSTGEGIYLPTFNRLFYRMFDREVFETGVEESETRVVEAGHGKGEFALRLAHLYSNFQVTGIEFDSDLYADSLKVLEKAEEKGFVKRDQVQLLPGDFNDARFRTVFQSADIVYYYAQSTDNLAAFAATLAQNLKPGAKIVEFGPYEQLEHALSQSAPGVFDSHVVELDIRIHTRRGEIRPETRSVVAQEVASRILREADARVSEIFDVLFMTQTALAGTDQILGNEEETEHIEILASLLKRDGNAVIPTAALQSLAPGSRDIFLKVPLQAAKQNGDPITSPAIYFAGEGASKLISELSTSEVLKNEPQAKRIFRVVPESEWKMAGRPDVEPAAISSFRLPGEGESAPRRFAAFLLKPEEIKELSEAEKIQYLLRLMELELLAAEELKFPLMSASESDVPKLVGQFLMNIGIQDFDSNGGIFTLSKNGLLGEAFAEYLRSSLIARSA